MSDDGISRETAETLIEEWRMAGDDGDLLRGARSAYRTAADELAHNLRRDDIAGSGVAHDTQLKSDMADMLDHAAECHALLQERAPDDATIHTRISSADHGRHYAQASYTAYRKPTVGKFTPGVTESVIYDTASDSEEYIHDVEYRYGPLFDESNRYVLNRFDVIKTDD